MWVAAIHGAAYRQPMATVPKAEDTEPRTCTPTFRVSDSENRRIRAAAKKRGHKVATFLRLAVMASVEEIETSTPKPATKKRG